MLKFATIGIFEPNNKIPEKRCKTWHFRESKENQNYDKSFIHLPRQKLYFCLKWEQIRKRLNLEKFEKENGSYICNDLLGCDISTAEGVQYAMEHNCFTEVCPKMVASAVKILEDMG